MDRSTAESREERQEKIIMLEEKIKLFQERIEVCGEEGEVDEAKELQGKVETYGAQLASMKV